MSISITHTVKKTSAEGTQSKTLVPKLRFKGFDDSWKKKGIGSILTIGSGRDYKHLGSGDIPVYGTGGLMTMVDKFLYDGATVCIGRKGTIDKPMYFEGKLWTVDTLFYTHSFLETNPKFVFNLFQKIKWKEHNEASGVPSLSKTTIEKIKVSIPTLPEQKKIASFLSAVDEKIQQLTRKKELLEQYKKGVMQQLFSGKLRFKPALNGVEGDENGKVFPNWEEKRLGDVAEVNPKNSGLPNTFIYIDLESVNSGRLISENRIGKDEAPSRAQRKLAKNDILFQTVRPYQMNNFFFNLDGDYIASTGYAQLRTKEDPMFLFQFLHSKRFSDNVMERCTGTSFPAINPTELSKIKISLPNIAEQKKIATYLSHVDTKIESVTKQITQTQTFKKGLLQQMFV